MIPPVSVPGGPRPRRTSSNATIDLRFHEAKWTYRQLQARVRHAREGLAEARVEADARVAVSDPPAGFGDSVVRAQEAIAREWAETAQASAGLLARADDEVRRILETATAEVEALVDEASGLRSRPVAGQVVVPPESGSGVEPVLSRSAAARPGHAS